MTSTWLFSKSAVSQIGMYHRCKENHGFSPRSFISQLFIALEFAGLGQETLEGRRSERSLWQKGRKKLIRLGVRGREENSTEGMKLNVEKAGRWRSEELWEASLQVSMFFWGCSHSLESFPLSLYLFFSWDWFRPSLLLSVLVTAHYTYNFLPLVHYKSNLKGFCCSCFWHCCCWGY